MRSFRFASLFAAAIVFSVSLRAVENPPSLLVEIRIGTGFEHRQLMGVADSFSAAAGPLVGWSRIKGADKPMKITHVWKWNGRVVSLVPLEVQSADFRTHSRTSVANRAGKWTLEVKDEAGRLLGSKEFEVR